MLGSNLGKKVTAGVVQDEYKQFLKNKPDEKKKVLTAEERKQAKRVEMRKRGVFVKADDPDEAPTVLEKGDGPPGQPVLFVLPEKPTLWKRSKKTATRKHKKSQKRKEKKVENESNGPPKKKTKQLKKETSSKSVVTSEATTTTTTTTSIEEKPADSKVTVISEGVRKHSAEKSTEDKTVEEKHDVKVVKTEQPVDQKPDEKVEEKVEQSMAQKTEQPVTGDSEKTEPPVEAKKSEEKVEKVSDDAASTRTALQPGEIQKADDKKEYASLTAVSSNPSMTEMKKAIPMAEKQTDAFDKLDDDEFEKMTSDADEKEMLKLAPRLLKVAKRHAAIEKCLTSEENEVLAKFFSGKQKLDANVLAVLDAALDKIIDYLQKNNCAVDEETKMVMKKRDKLKAAMMKEFLVSPQYLPKTWTAKFNEWKTEAEKQKNGINWFRVFFSYPKHKSFDDGPEDTFGNFRRRHRSFWLGIILGPGDVKSFEETKREDDCQGMFLDTKIIEKAADTTTTVSTTISTATAVSDRRMPKSGADKGTL